MLSWFPFNNGREFANSLIEEKRIFLLNAACIIWFSAYLGIISLGLFVPEFNSKLSLTVIIEHSTLLIVTQVLQSKGKLVWARSVFTFGAFLNFFIFDYFVHTDYSIEFYYIVPVLLAQLLFDNKKLLIVLLLVAIVLFFDFFIWLDSEQLPSLHFINYFVALFLIVDMLIRINEKKQQLLIEQKNNLEELNRFQSNFFVNISHELRTPLTIIKGATARLNKDNINERKDLIEVQTNSINRIIDDMIDLTKLQFNKLQLNISRVNVSSILKKIHASFATAYNEKKIELYLSLTKNFYINCDPIYLERAINNLLLNSLKYTNEGSVTMSVKESKKGVEMSIIDTGIGIPKDELEQIPSRFYQGDNTINKSSGTGLGLSFTKEIIDLHSGDFEISSKVGIGTTITLSIPLLESAPLDTDVEPNTLAESTPPKPIIKKKSGSKILVVEDNTDMLNYLCEMLDRFQVTTARNGKEALNILSNHTFDLILTDYMMPIMNGKELISEIIKTAIDIPTLMLTAKSSENSKLEMLRLGIDDYITKPFNETEVLVRIENLLRTAENRKGFISELSKNKESEKEDIPFIKNLKKYIQHNCNSIDFGVPALCDEFAMSNSSMYRKVKYHTGLSTQDLIKEVRLQRAYDMVCSNEVDSIKELAAAIGFAKPSYLSEVYYRRFGCKPFEKTEIE